MSYSGRSPPVRGAGPGARTEPAGPARAARRPRRGAVPLAERPSDDARHRGGGRLAWVACLRWTIEEDFELSKGEAGLDHYEVTRFRSWYHRITLSLLALAFLKSIQRDWGESDRSGRGGLSDASTARPSVRSPTNRGSSTDRESRACHARLRVPSRLVGVSVLSVDRPRGQGWSGRNAGGSTKALNEVSR
jgi:hypothetical protein